VTATDNPKPWKLPYELCEVFRTVNDRTATLENLDVRQGIELIVDDPRFAETAEYRGSRYAVPEYAKILAKWVYDAQTGGPSSEDPLDFKGHPVPDAIQNILAGEDAGQGTLF
jgi:hypothetical protein